jgi:hypothetical protein
MKPGGVTVVTIVTVESRPLLQEPTMPLATACDALIPLVGGPTIRTSVVIWLLDTSERLTLRAESDGSVFVGPRAAVTAADLEFVRAHRDEVLAAIKYVDLQAARPM